MLVAVLLPTAAESASAPTEPVYIYAERYSAPSGRVSPIDLVTAPDGGGDSGKAVPYSAILGSFQHALEKGGKSVQIIQNKDQADFHFLFVEIPFVYTEKDNPKQIEPPSGHRGFPPPLSLNKHAGSSAETRELTSPWLRATLYTDHNKQITGGIIVVPIAEFVRLLELDHAARGEWDAFAATPMDTKDQASANPQLLNNTTIQYSDTFLRTSLPRPDDNRLRAMFGSKGEQALFIARLTAISGVFDGVAEIGQARQHCMEFSSPFYRTLYDSLLTAMLSLPSGTAMTHNAHYTFVPTTETIKAIAANSGDYNCFIHPPYTRKAATP